MLGFAYLQITFLISIGLQWTDKKMDRPTQIHLRYYSYVGYCIDTNNFFNFDWIATKIALLPGKWLKDFKYGLRFEIGWCKVGFYKPLTDRRTDRQKDGQTHSCYCNIDVIRKYCLLKARSIVATVDPIVHV